MPLVALRLRPCCFAACNLFFVRALSIGTIAPASSQPRPWPGLRSWRDAPPNESRSWGSHGPSPSPPHDPIAMPAASLSECAASVLSTVDPLVKSRLSHLAYSRWCRREIPVGSAVSPVCPARPEKPLLVRTRILLFLILILVVFIFLSDGVPGL